MFNKKKIVITGVSAGGIATYLYSNLFYLKSISAKVHSIPDSGLFLTDYLSNITGKQTIRQASRALADVVWGRPQHYPLQKCLQQFINNVVQCFNAQNLAKYVKPSMLVIKSSYDHSAITQIQGITCYTNSKSPYSIQNCNQTQMKVIKDYRDKSRQAIIKMLKDKPNTGFWVSSCIQHGWKTSNFNDSNYKVPGLVGKSMPQTIQKFLDNPDNPPIYIDTVNWPDNKGCNGINSTYHMRWVNE